MSLLSTLSAIDVHSVDEKQIRGYQSEATHYSEAFGLFREAAAYVCVLANTTVGDTDRWSVRQAVFGGHLVRMFKLMRFILEESVDHREELQSILVRLVAESVINLRYLVKHDSESLIKSFLLHSLHHEHELATLIRKNIADRKGESLPIERRMLRSIQKTFEKSGIAEEDVPRKKARNWGNKNLFEKASAVGLGEAYHAIFGGPSRNVHGGWQDLLHYHLESVGPLEFKPQLAFREPRPQPIFALTKLVAETLDGYVELLGHPAIWPLVPRLNDLLDRNELASHLHEDYLVARSAA